MSYMELLLGKEETLLRIIHPNVLLLALLTEHDMLDECTEQAIAAERTNFDRNRRLLEWLKHSPREAFDVFLRALRTNGQEHVANYIDGTPGKRGKDNSAVMAVNWCGTLNHLYKILDLTPELTSDVVLESDSVLESIFLRTPTRTRMQRTRTRTLRTRTRTRAIRTQTRIQTAH